MRDATPPETSSQDKRDMQSDNNGRARDATGEDTTLPGGNKLPFNPRSVPRRCNQALAELVHVSAGRV